MGKLYLTGKDELTETNVIDPFKANKYLLTAHEYAVGIYRTHEDFKDTLADCKFYLSLSFFTQLTGKKDSSEQLILANAIKYCTDAVALNPNLSVGYYHLALFYNYIGDVDKVVLNLEKAIKIERKYSFLWDKEEVNKRKVFEGCKSQILILLERLRVSKLESAKKKLELANRYLRILRESEINKSVFYTTYLDLYKFVKQAEQDFNSQTYVGLDDCEIKLDTL